VLAAEILSGAGPDCMAGASRSASIRICGPISMMLERGNAAPLQVVATRGGAIRGPA